MSIRRPGFANTCFAIYEQLDDYFIGEDISSLGLVSPKANGRVIYLLRRHGLIQPIEACYERFVYRKSSASVNQAAVLTVINRVRIIKREQTRYIRALQRCAPGAGSAHSPPHERH